MDHLRAIGVMIGACIVCIGLIMIFFGTRNEKRDAGAWIAGGLGIAVSSFFGPLIF
jgi:hypothetical protein